MLWFHVIEFTKIIVHLIVIVAVVTTYLINYHYYLTVNIKYIISF